MEKLLEAARKVLKDRRESLADTFSGSELSTYMEGASDALSFLIANLHPNLGGACDVKELIDK